MTSEIATQAGSGSVSVYFIRHGETLWSLSGQHTGNTDLPLTEVGEEQASAVGLLLQDIRFVRVFSSPLQRALRTCTLSRLNPPPEVDPDLSEWDYGDYEGLKTRDIRRDRPSWNVFRDGCPNGETTPEVAARADRVIARLRVLEGNVAVFSHGQFGAVLAARWIGLRVRTGQHFPLEAASLSILGYEPSHPEFPVISLWNETATRVASPSR